MSLRKAQARLKKIADQISKNKQLDDIDTEFLDKAFTEIYNGEDANAALGVKAKKGERKGKHDRDTKKRLQYFYPWLATATAKVKKGGLGMSDKNAVAIIAKQLPHIQIETVARYWRQAKKTQQETFKIKTD